MRFPVFEILGWSNLLFLMVFLGIIFWLLIMLILLAREKLIEMRARNRRQLSEDDDRNSQ